MGTILRDTPKKDGKLNHIGHISGHICNNLDNTLEMEYYDQLKYELELKLSNGMDPEILLNIYDKYVELFREIKKQHK